MEDVIGVITVIGEHIVGYHRTWLEFVGSSIGSTQPAFSGIVDIGTVRVESEFVDLPQTSVRVEWG